ncbi:hypothetical protein PAESOLCIP111_05606 [Paenibacillus solanacearum]|uniref:Uncharacterized protein n=1 Tax=Paenibacillus solanacearum TaxID=2048548 RepID=A0A916K7T6_9BACL|nr:hypothetical protein PAESOLCIP111_05606 [Paenibacillus solanacearum]
MNIERIKYQLFRSTTSKQLVFVCPSEHLLLTTVFGTWLSVAYNGKAAAEERGGSVHRTVWLAPYGGMTFSLIWEHLFSFDSKHGMLICN